MTMNCEFERMWKEAVWTHLRHNPGIDLGEDEENHEKLKYG
jgi:hypothetical protein